MRAPVGDFLFEGAFLDRQHAEFMRATLENQKNSTPRARSARPMS